MGGLIAINLWRGPADMSMRDQSLNEMVHTSLTRFHYACQQLWGDRGSQENCIKKSLSEMLRNISERDFLMQFSCDPRSPQSCWHA